MSSLTVQANALDTYQATERIEFMFATGPGADPNLLRQSAQILRDEAHGSAFSASIPHMIGDVVMALATRLYYGTGLPMSIVFQRAMAIDLDCVATMAAMGQKVLDAAWRMDEDYQRRDLEEANAPILLRALVAMSDACGKNILESTSISIARRKRNGRGDKGVAPARCEGDHLEGAGRSGRLFEERPT